MMHICAFIKALMSGCIDSCLYSSNCVIKASKGHRYVNCDGRFAIDLVGLKLYF